MTIKLFFVIFFSSIMSCRLISEEDDKIVVLETTTAPIKQDYKISWSDSGKVQFKLSVDSYTYPNLDYDSARILYYWGYNLDEGLDTTSFFPINTEGKWISTIMYSAIITKADLSKVDSLLGNQKSFDESSAAGTQSPKYGIVYLKKGKVIGQTTIGPGSQTVRTTFKLPEPCYSQRLNNSECRQIEVVFWKKLHIHGL
jgi:hypothetical protein